MLKLAVSARDLPVQVSILFMDIVGKARAWADAWAEAEAEAWADTVVRAHADSRPWLGMSAPVGCGRSLTISSRLQSF